MYSDLLVVSTVKSPSILVQVLRRIGDGLGASSPAYVVFEVVISKTKGKIHNPKEDFQNKAYL